MLNGFLNQNSKKNYVYYSYEVSWNDGSKSLETTILSFGRKGYHKINLIKKIDENFDAREFESMAKILQIILNLKMDIVTLMNKSGDKTAAVGIGSLVVGTLGVKALAKVGVLTKILSFALKFWWILLAPLVLLAGLFNKKSTSGKIISEKSTRKKKKTKKKND